VRLRDGVDDASGSRDVLDPLQIEADHRVTVRVGHHQGPLSQGLVPLRPRNGSMNVCQVFNSAFDKNNILLGGTIVI